MLLTRIFSHQNPKFGHCQSISTPDTPDFAVFF